MPGQPNKKGGEGGGGVVPQGLFKQPLPVRLWSQRRLQRPLWPADSRASAGGFSHYPHAQVGGELRGWPFITYAAENKERLLGRSLKRLWLRWTLGSVTVAVGLGWGGGYLRWVSLLDGGSDIMSDVSHTAAGYQSRTIGLKKGGCSLHWAATLVRWSLGQSRPSPGSWVASADCRNVTPGLPSTGLRQTEEESAGRMKSGDLRCWTVTGREGTWPLLHAWRLPMCRNSLHGQFTQEVETWRGRAGRLSGRGTPWNMTQYTAPDMRKNNDCCSNLSFCKSFVVPTTLFHIFDCTTYLQPTNLLPIIQNIFTQIFTHDVSYAR